MKRRNKKAATKAKSKVFTSWYEFNKWLISQDYNITKPIFSTNHSGDIPKTTITIQ